jgi:hypothetical protein
LTVLVTVSWSGLAQLWQKRLPEGFSVRQFGQVTGASLTVGAWRGLRGEVCFVLSLAGIAASSKDVFYI